MKLETPADVPHLRYPLRNMIAAVVTPTSLKLRLITVQTMVAALAGAYIKILAITGDATLQPTCAMAAPFQTATATVQQIVVMGRHVIRLPEFAQLREEKAACAKVVAQSTPAQTATVLVRLEKTPTNLAALQLLKQVHQQVPQLMMIIVKQIR